MSIASLPHKSIPTVKPPLAASQQGAALIMALMVVVLVALLATTMGNDFLVTFRRVENQMYGKQADAYMRGAESMARKFLQDDFNNSASKERVHPGEDIWLNTPVDVPLDEVGVMSGILCDLQGRFNVNNLQIPLGQGTQGTQGTQAPRYTPDQEMFIRLLQTLDLDPVLERSDAEEITHAVIDWLDIDDTITNPGGAEDGYYSDLEIPHLAANQLMKSASELRWVKGITADVYRKLAKHVIALEVGTKVNINTATVNILRSIKPEGDVIPHSESDGEEIREARDGDSGATGTLSGGSIKTGFGDPTEVNNAGPYGAAPPDLRTVVYNSEHFLLDTSMQFLDRKFKLYSVLHRDSSGNITTIARARYGLGKCVGN